MGVDFSDKATRERYLAEMDWFIERLRVHEAEHGEVTPASAAVVRRVHYTKAQQLPVIKALLIQKGWLKM